MADDNRTEEQSTGVVAWLAAPPLLRQDVARLGTLIDDMLNVLQPFNPRAIHTDEPRIYRLTPLGRSLLREAINAECVNLIMFNFGEHSIAVDRVIAYIGGDTLYSGQRWVPAFPTEVAISMVTPDAAVHAEMAQRFTNFMQQQSAALNAAAAFVTQLGDGRHPGVTGYEYAHDLPKLSWWKDIERFARGAFWATFLGPTQCDQMGGQKSVVRTAPVWRAESIGRGVWLRTSRDFPEAEEDIAQLLEFLSPILSWTKDDLTTSSEIDKTYGVPSQTFPPKWFGDVSDPTRRQQLLIPLKRLSTYCETDSQIVLNIYADGALSAEQRVILEIALHTWRYNGHEDGFDGAFIGWMSFLSYSDASVRCTVSLDHHDAPLHALQGYLSILFGVTVKEIILGMEEMG